MKRTLLSVVALAFVSVFSGQSQINPAGATETTPSHSEYFSWINHSFEGPTEKTTLAGLDFFRYLKETYGMQLDIYALDAGTIDGWKLYDSMDSERVRQHFPRGFGPIAEFSAQDGTKLGMWCGPDGFGNTDQEAQARLDMMVSLVRDYNVGLFKMDACCGDLRPSKCVWVEKMMSQVRNLCPDLVLLNHRLDLGPATKYSTTFLLGGAETYIDVHMRNEVTAPHHRVTALAREVPDTRLTEDHGVCLSSCLDYWDDDLILQAFNRELILAPEIYGNPWLLRDDEYSRLAYIYNLHRDNREILVNGLRLPEEKYGLNAMSRGDGNTRFLTLRNLSWEPVTYHISLSDEIGITGGSKVQVRMYHPYIEDMGIHSYGSSVDVTVLPFRSCMVKATTVKENDKVTVSGVPYRIVNDRVGDKYEIELMGRPGETYRYKVKAGSKSKSGSVTFPGTVQKESPYRLVSSMEECPVPEDAETIYYSTIFAADNNALEVRCLERSGETAIPQVKAARDAFFTQERFIGRGVWDRNLFDGDYGTYFDVAFRWGDFRQGDNSMFTLDFGEPIELDKLVFSTDSEFSLGRQKMEQGTYVYVSADLKEWKQLMFVSAINAELDMRSAGAVRYLRFEDCPLRLSEVTGYKNGVQVNRDAWKASNLFNAYGSNVGEANHAWKAEFVLDEIPANSYLCVAVNGKHGTERAWAGFKIDGEYVGCPDRAPSYPSNTWECPVRQTDSNCTYYLPLTEDMKGKKIEAYVLTMWGSRIYGELTPEVRMSAYPLPFGTQMVTLPR